MRLFWGAMILLLLGMPVSAQPGGATAGGGAVPVVKPTPTPGTQPGSGAAVVPNRLLISKPAAATPQQAADAASPQKYLISKPATTPAAQPDAPIVVQPSAPVVVQPGAPVVVQPGAPVVVQPVQDSVLGAQPGSDSASVGDPNVPQRELISAVPTDGSEAPVAGADVYILAGQSNMQGTAKVKGLPAVFNHPLPTVFFWNGADFEQLLPGKTKTSGREDEFGPEISFAATLAGYQPGRLIYLIKYNAGDLALHHGWNGDYWEGGEAKPSRQNFYPGEGPDDPNAGMQYLNLRNMARTALDNLRKTTLPFRVRALVWVQGEHDAKQAESALAYATNLARLKRRIEEDLGCGTVPLVYGQVLPYEPALTRFVARQEVRASQQAAHGLSGQPTAIRGAWMVPTDGMPLLPDTVHYAPMGQAMLGEALALGVLQAEEVLKMKGAQETPAGSLPAADGQTSQPLSGQQPAGSVVPVQPIGGGVQPVVVPVQPGVAPGQSPVVPEENTIPL